MRPRRDVAGGRAPAHERSARGRNRDEDARRRILDAAFVLVGERGPGRVSINDIADAVGVGKQTIYRWWPSRTSVVLDAFVDGTIRATPFAEGDDVRTDFRRHLESVVRLFGSPAGAIIRELVAESQTDETIAAEFRERFWQPRRDVSRVRLERGIALGQVRPDLDVELVLDAVYGPLWLRLLIGHVPMRTRDARRVVDVVWDGIAP